MSKPQHALRLARSTRAPAAALNFPLQLPEPAPRPHSLPDMKTLLTLVVALMAGFILYAATQDLRAVKIDELAPPDPDKAVPERAVLKALIWDGYIPEQVFERMRIETGIRTEARTYRTNEEFLAMFESGEEFDLVMVSDFVARQLDRRHLSVDINYAHIPNHRHIIAGMRRSEQMSRLFRCSVPYIFGTVGLGYNADQVERLPLSWRALFNPRTPGLLRGRTAVIDDPRHALGIALLALGKSPNSRDPAEVRAAGDLVIKSMGNLTRLGNYDLGKRMEENQVYVSMAWGGDIAFAMEKNKDLRFISPDEGALLFFDCFAIIRSSTQRAAAEEFIDYMLRPDISARVTNFSYYATVNGAALPYVDRTLINGPAYYVPHGREIHYREDLGDDEAIYREVWADVRRYYLANVKPTLDAEISFDERFIEGNDEPVQPAAAQRVGALTGELLD